MKVDQATGLCGGIVVSSRLNSPSWRSWLRLGRTSQWRSRKLGSMPSIPSTTTLFPAAFAVCRAQPNEPKAAAAIKRGTTLKRTAIDLRLTEDRPPFHPAGARHAEQLQDGG